MEMTENQVCRNCWGMKVIELPNGDTTPCPACKGQGIVKVVKQVRHMDNGVNDE